MLDLPSGVSEAEEDAEKDGNESDWELPFAGFLVFLVL